MPKKPKTKKKSGARKALSSKGKKGTGSPKKVRRSGASKVKKAKPKSKPRLKIKPKSKPKAKPKSKSKAKPKSRPKSKPKAVSRAGRAKRAEVSGTELGFRPPSSMIKVSRKSTHKVPSLLTIKKRFLQMKEDLLREIATSIENQTDHRYEIGDIYDMATSERDREFSLLVGNRNRQRLKEIDEALLRIQDKTYGVCEECGERISPGRLLAMPFTNCCVKCKEESERREVEDSLLERPDEEERIYGNIEDMEDFEES